MERVGTRDIEGKVTRVGANKSGGERVSIKKEGRKASPRPEGGLTKNKSLTLATLPSKSPFTDG